MKKTLIASFVTAASAVAAIAAEPDMAQLQGIPKNLARQHLGANLFQYNTTTQTYSPTQASAAWLDDDISTGWAMMNGKQYYLLAFPQSEVIENFSLSARPASGTISFFASDEIAPPTAKTWTPLAKDVPFDSINERKSAKKLSRAAKYLLIETDLKDAGAVYSLYVYGDRAAVAYDVASREQPISTTSVFGPYANEATAFSVTGLYAKSWVVPQQGQGSITEAQAAIDDNPETSLAVGGGKPSTVEIRTAQPRTISRVAMEVNPGAKGRFEFFLKNGADDAPLATDAVPAGTIILDGSAGRASVDFAGAPATTVLARWTPANGTDAVSVREMNAFGGLTLAANTVSTSVVVDPIAEGPEGTGRKVARTTNNSGKDYKDPKMLEEVAEGPRGGPYLPGALGFPPNPTLRRVVVPPEEPVSQ